MKFHTINIARPTGLRYGRHGKIKLRYVGLNFCNGFSFKFDVQTPTKNSLQPSQISQTVFEIAYRLAWNFRNKFRNIFKPNDRQFFSKMLIFWKTVHNFFPKF
jgi:hypothetical protein